MSDAQVLVAMGELRAVRRQRRIGDVVWGDLAYRVYTTALGCIVLAIFASGWVGDSELSRQGVASVRDHGPAWAGVVAAVLVFLGARSGYRGGPLALEAADVHHLLLAPIPRSRVLRRPAVGALGYGAAAGAAVGALCGMLLAQRLPGGNAAFISSGVLFGAVAAAGGFGFAFLCSARRFRPALVVTLAALGLLASLLEAFGVVGWSPFGVLGAILFWPLGFDALSLVPLVAVVALCWLGLHLIGGLSVEAAQRRTKLVGQLRFAVTQQDLRSVLLLRRQLASERPRNRSLLRFLPRFIGVHFPVLMRGLQSIGRWPTVRIVRVGVLGVAAGLAARGIWSGTTPLILVAGLAVYVAALDATEPLAQEIDHPLLVDSYPHDRGTLFQRHLAAPVLVMVATTSLGAAVAIAMDASLGALAVAAVTVVASSLSSVAGACISIVSEAVLDSVDQAIMPPEVAGPRVVFRMAWPPLVAISGFVPVLAAQRAFRSGAEVIGPTLWGALLPVGLFAVVFIWIRYRDEMHESMNEAMGR